MAFIHLMEGLIFSNAFASCSNGYNVLVLTANGNRTLANALLL